VISFAPYLTGFVPILAGCSYFAARSMADDAYIVFCPYSYIINPIVRRAMEVDIKGAVLILDEAQYALQSLLSRYIIFMFRARIHG